MDAEVGVVVIGDGAVVVVVRREEMSAAHPDATVPSMSQCC